MSDAFLDKIVRSTRESVGVRKSTTDFASLENEARVARSLRETNSLYSALSKNDRTNIIAEFKRASPSKGVINDVADVAHQVRKYEDQGAAAISVLTEEQYFKGSLEDLQAARAAVRLPILRKDFTVDEFQIYEAAAAGADAILLIVAILTSQELKDFSGIAKRLGMDSLVEVHTAAELEIAIECEAEIIGINNRNLKTFEVSLDVSRDLIAQHQSGALMISESGISSREEIEELRSLGFNGFLVGESLMRNGSLATLQQVTR